MSVLTDMPFKKKIIVLNVKKTPEKVESGADLVLGEDPPPPLTESSLGEDCLHELTMLPALLIIDAKKLEIDGN